MAAETEQTAVQNDNAFKYDDLIKHEQDSADLTMSRIPVSSRGTDQEFSGAEEDKKDGEESKQSAQMSDIVVGKPTIKRQLTMERV